MLWGGAGGGVEIRDHTLTTIQPQSMLPSSHTRKLTTDRDLSQNRAVIAGSKNFAFPTKYSQQPSLRESTPTYSIADQVPISRFSSHPSLMLWGGAGGGVEIRDQVQIHHSHPNPCYPALTCALTTDRDRSQNRAFREEKHLPVPSEKFSNDPLRKSVAQQFE